jgi:hypothetical protein
MARRLELLTDDAQHQELVQARDHDPRPYVRERAAAMLKIAEGEAAYRVAKHGLLKERDPDTLYAWLRVYQAYGLAGLVAHQQGGARRRRLRPEPAQGGVD